MLRVNPILRLVRLARFSTGQSPRLRPNVSKVIASRITTPLDYKFPTNTLINPMTEYVELKQNTVCGNAGSRSKKKRLGRGRGSGHGKSCGHGQKGQGHRRNFKYWGFEGGQTPLHRRLPKFGRTKQNRRRLDYVNIEKLVYFMKRKWLSSTPEKYITIKDMVDTGLLRRAKWGVKLLSKGADRLQDIKTPIFIEVTDCSKTAADIIRSNGGQVRIKYFTKLKLREHLRPEQFPLPLADPLPPQKKVLQIEKYRDYGCEVQYNVPRWAKEELEKGREYFQPRQETSFAEVVNATRMRVRKILPRQYKFDLV